MDQTDRVPEGFVLSSHQSLEPPTSPTSDQHLEYSDLFAEELIKQNKFKLTDGEV